MSKSPRSLFLVNVYYSPSTLEGKKIYNWVLQQNNVSQAVRDLILLYGEDYNKLEKPQKLTLYQRRRLGGLCVRCGKPAGGKSRCENCLAKLKSWREQKQNEKAGN